MKDYNDIYNAIPVIFSDQITYDSLFHYTSIEGFLLMMRDIQDKKCYLFPGNIRYQNDSAEIQEGVSIIKKLTGSKKEFESDTVEQIDNHLREKMFEALDQLNNNDFYISCFSMERDLLEQWKYYGKDCGLSIEFDFKECEGFWEGDISKIEIKVGSSAPKYSVEKHKEYDNNYLFNWDDNESCDDSFSIKEKRILTQKGVSLYPIKVIYEDNLKEVFFKKNILENYSRNKNKLKFSSYQTGVKECINWALSIFIPICKNHFYEHEREARLIFYPFDKTKIEYRVKNNRILPYLKCLIVNKDGNKYPIKSVTVGPGNNQNLVFNAVINIIEGNENKMYFTDDAINKERKECDQEKVFNCIPRGHLGRVKCKNSEVSTVYRSFNDILVYKSPIPFRD